jgi:hypothetical protein
VKRFLAIAVLFCYYPLALATSIPFHLPEIQPGMETRTLKLFTEAA